MATSQTSNGLPFQSGTESSGSWESTASPTWGSGQGSWGAPDPDKQEISKLRKCIAGLKSENEGLMIANTKLTLCIKKLEPVIGKIMEIRNTLDEITLPIQNTICLGEHLAIYDDKK